jgi:hypothetical protein
MEKMYPEYLPGFQNIIARSPAGLAMTGLIGLSSNTISKSGVVA